MAVKEVGEALPDASSEEIIQLTSGSSSAIFKGLSDSERGAVITRITNAMGNVWLLFMVAAALSFASALCLGVSFALLDTAQILLISYETLESSVQDELIGQCGFVNKDKVNPIIANSRPKMEGDLGEITCIF